MKRFFATLFILILVVSSFNNTVFADDELEFSDPIYQKFKGQNIWKIKVTMLESLMEYGFLLEVLQPETSAILNLSLLDIISFKALNEFSEYVSYLS